MQKHLKPFSFIMVCLLLIVSCQEPDGVDKMQNEATMSLRTVDAKEVSIDFKKKNQNKSANWITPYFQFTDSIPLINSNAQITVTPVTTTVPDAYSRLFSIEIDGNLETVVYHMFANDQSTDVAFWGRAIITDLNGDILSAWDVEDNIFTGYYDVANHPETLSILNYNKNTTTKNTGGGDDDEWEDPDDILGETTIIAPGSGGSSAEIKIIYYPEFTLGDDESVGGSTNPADPTDDEPAAGANSMNEDSCDPGQQKCKDNCYDLCPQGFNRNNNCFCEKDPCAEIDNLFHHENGHFKNKILELEGKTDKTFETGYGFNLAYYPAFLPRKNNGKSVTSEYLNLNGYYGFIHTHTCVTEEDNEVNIQIHSHSDLFQFSRLVKYAHLNGRPLDTAFITVVNCDGIFDLRYTGTYEDFIKKDFNHTKEEYLEFFEGSNDYLLAFKDFLDQEVGSDGLEIYQYIKNDFNDEYDVNKLLFNEDNTDYTNQNDCN